MKIEFQINLKSLYSKEYLIKGINTDLKNELIKFDKVNKEKSFLKIFVVINQKRFEHRDRSSPNYYLLMLNDIKVLKEYQEISCNIINNIVLKLNIKITKQDNIRDSANMKVVAKTENNINNDKLVYKPIININNGALSMKERVKLFNKKNNNNNPPANAEQNANTKEAPPKKLVINPNLYDKEGKIKIMKSRDKVIFDKRNQNLNAKKDKSFNESKTRENELQNYLYGSTKEEKDSKTEKPKHTRIKKRGEIPKPKPDDRNNLSNYAKNKTEINKGVENVIKSLKNPKSQYEQEKEKEKEKEQEKEKQEKEKQEKEKNEEIKVKKVTFGERLRNNFRNIVESMSPRRKVTESRAQTQGGANITKKKTDESIKEITKEEKEKIEEKKKDLKNENKMNYKNRNFSSNTRKVKINKYKMSEKELSEILNESNAKNKEYYKKEYVNLEPVNYGEYLKKVKVTKKPIDRETFCEGFFIASFPFIKGEVIENSQSFPSPCGHKECSTFPAMKPVIIMRYPLNDTKNLELNNLAATICFPTGIKVCYNEEGPTDMFDDYLTSITNQKGERYYMMTYHFYQKIGNNEYTKNYEMHPLKNHLMKFGDSYLTLSDEGFTEKIIKQVQETLEFCQELGFRDYVYVPFCLSIISKYPYEKEMTKCLQSIFNVISEEQIMTYSKTNFKINDLIMYLINSVPIPIEKKTRVKFYIPFFDRGISLKCPKIDEINVVNINYIRLIEFFSIENVMTILRLLLFEKKILFIDDDYTRLSEISDAFITLLYPFKWVHTYIPIMSDQMLKYLETFLPFLNGIHSSLMPLVTSLFNNSEVEDDDDVFLIDIKQGKIDLSSSLRKKKKKVPKKYIQSTVPALPINIEKKLRTRLTEISNSYNNYMKQPIKRDSRQTDQIDLSQFDKNISDLFLEIFVDMFRDYPKYICLLDNDYVFNKNSFMNSVNKADKAFFDEFIDTQLFQQFTQTIFTDECDYFNKMISTDVEDQIEFTGISLDKNEKIFIIPPKYLGTDETENTSIERFVSQYYPTNLESNYIAKEEFKDINGVILPCHRVIPSIIEIQNEDYNENNCLIYFLPNQNRVSMKRTLLRDSSVQLFQNIKPKSVNKNEAQELGLRKTLTSANFNEGLNEREKDEIKEIVKDYLRNIYRSMNIDYKDPKIKTEILNILKKSFGRETFINLLSTNSKNIVSLQLDSFKFLTSLIYNVLVESVKIPESDQLLGEIYLLIKSTMYFSVDHKGKTITLFHHMKRKLKDFPILNQNSFWNIWFEKEIELKKDRGDSTKQIIILNICSKMVELEIQKIIIKNILDDLSNKAFGENSEMGKQTQKLYMRKIQDAKYTLLEKQK